MTDRTAWPDRYLVGNGETCSACKGERVTRGRFDAPIRCQTCDGRGRVRYGERKVYDTTTKHAKEVR